MPFFVLHSMVPPNLLTTSSLLSCEFVPPFSCPQQHLLPIPHCLPPVPHCPPHFLTVAWFHHGLTMSHLIMDSGTPRQSLASTLHSTSVHHPSSCTCTPTSLDSSQAHRTFSITGLPWNVSFSWVRHQVTYTMDFLAFCCSPALHPYGSS